MRRPSAERLCVVGMWVLIGLFAALYWHYPHMMNWLFYILKNHPVQVQQ